MWAWLSRLVKRKTPTRTIKVMTIIRQAAAIVSGRGSVTPVVRVGTPPVFTTAPTTAGVAVGGTIYFLATDPLDRTITYSLVDAPPGYSIAGAP